MKVHHCEAAGALRLRRDDSDIVDARELETGIVPDFEAGGPLAGCEVPTQRVPAARRSRMHHGVA
jgi:hypothetical protein